MSKRSSLSGKTMTARNAGLVLFLFVSLVAVAQTEAQITDTRVQIYGGRNNPLGGQAIVRIALSKEAGQPAFGGFDFMITYDTVGFDFLSAEPGALLDSCGWEYFHYSKGSIPGIGPVVRLVAVAETDNGNIHPTCYLDGPVGGSLADMTFQASSDSNLECQSFEVQFLWHNCADNSMSSVDGDTLYVAQYGCLPDGDCPTPPPATLHTSQGLPDFCLDDTINGQIPMRLITFKSDFVGIACSDTVDQRGDLNLNGIAYELADLVTYANYFLYGYSAFTIMLDAQVAASDVNVDGWALEFRDFVYLYRIIIGDAPPLQKVLYGDRDTLMADFVQNVTTKHVSIDYPGHLAGAYLIFTGEITPTFHVPSGTPGLINAYEVRNDSTFVLICPYNHTSHGSGVWMAYDGEGTLDSVETTDWQNSRVTTRIVLTSEPIACGDVNGSGAVGIGDVVSLVQYIFSSGLTPADSHGGDVNCDQICNVADAVYLIRYIFSSGPAPCAAC